MLVMNFSRFSSLFLSGIKSLSFSNFIAGRPKAALLFWFFGDFKCGALLFTVILVVYE